MVYVVGMAAIYDAALLYGLVLALSSSGFILTHTTSKFPNLGHTLNLGVGMLTAFIFSQTTGLPVLASMPAVILITGFYSLGTYRVVFKRIVKPELAALAGLGLLYAGTNILFITLHYLRTKIKTNWWCGPASMSIEGLHFHYPRNNYLGVTESTWISIVIIGLAVIGFQFIKKQKIYNLFTAFSENPFLIMIQGINTEKNVQTSWFISGSLGGLAGAIMPYLFKGYPGRASTLAFVPVIASAAFAGMCSPKLGFLAGLVIGFLEILLVTLGQATIGVWVGEYRELFSMIVMVGAFAVMSLRRDQST